MKYSITCDPNIEKSHLFQKYNYTKTTSDYHSTSSLQVINQNELTLFKYINKERQIEEDSSNIVSVKTEMKIQQKIEWQNVCFIWEGDDEWLLVLQKPFQLLFVLKKYKKIVEIQLQNKLDLEQLTSFVSYPDLIMYGHSPANFTNHIYTVNLLTLEVKQLSAPKNYSPGSRTNYWAYFSDNRLYVTGGVDKNGVHFQQLLWTYNLQNGYWFALQMPMDDITLPQIQINCQFQSGKVLLIGDQQICIIQLYQSKAKRIDGWNSVIDKSVLKEVKSVSIHEDWIYFHSRSQTLHFKFKINKIKETK